MWRSSEFPSALPLALVVIFCSWGMAAASEAPKPCPQCAEDSPAGAFQMKGIPLEAQQQRRADAFAKAGYVTGVLDRIERRDNADEIEQEEASARPYCRGLYDAVVSVKMAFLSEESGFKKDVAEVRFRCANASCPGWCYRPCPWTSVGAVFVETGRDDRCFAGMKVNVADIRYVHADRPVLAALAAKAGRAVGQLELICNGSKGEGEQPCHCTEGVCPAPRCALRRTANGDELPGMCFPQCEELTGGEDACRSAKPFCLWTGEGCISAPCRAITDPDGCGNAGCDWDRRLEKCGMPPCYLYDKEGCPSDRCAPHDSARSQCRPLVCGELPLDSCLDRSPDCEWDAEKQHCAITNCAAFSGTASRCEQTHHCKVVGDAGFCALRRCEEIRWTLMCPEPECAIKVDPMRGPVCYTPSAVDGEL